MHKGRFVSTLVLAAALTVPGSMLASGWDPSPQQERPQQAKKPGGGGGGGGKKGGDIAVSVVFDGDATAYRIMGVPQSGNQPAYDGTLSDPDGTVTANFGMLLTVDFQVKGKNAGPDVTVDWVDIVRGGTCTTADSDGNVPSSCNCPADPLPDTVNGGRLQINPKEAGFDWTQMSLNEPQSMQGLLLDVGPKGTQCHLRWNPKHHYTGLVADAVLVTRTSDDTWAVTTNLSGIGQYVDSPSGATAVDNGFFELPFRLTVTR